MTTPVSVSTTDAELHPAGDAGFRPGLVSRLAAEAFGTLFLVIAGLGVPLFTIPQSNPLPAALAAGLAVTAAMLAFAYISGGHFNPAITLGNLVAGRIRIGPRSRLHRRTAGGGGPRCAHPLRHPADCPHHPGHQGRVRHRHRRIRRALRDPDTHGGGPAGRSSWARPSWSQSSSAPPPAATSTRRRHRSPSACPWPCCCSSARLWATHHSTPPVPPRLPCSPTAGRWGSCGCSGWHRWWARQSQASYSAASQTTLPAGVRPATVPAACCRGRNR